MAARRDRVRGPWATAARHVRRDRVAVASAALLGLILVACFAAPLWSEPVTGTDAYSTHLADTVVVDGERRDVVSLYGFPIGPTWQRQYFLGADSVGRDFAVRLAYGGRNSLAIGFAAAALTTLLATGIGLIAGYFGGWVDGVMGRALDIVWSFPVLLVGVALGTALAVGDAELGPLSPESTSRFITAAIVGIVSIPYMARPVRARVQVLANEPFVEAARAQGAGPIRILTRELLPNLTFTIVAFSTVLLANAVVLESALAFLGAGVRPPEPSWGTLVREGIAGGRVSPHLLVLPSLAITLTLLTINMLGEALREALDPHAPPRELA